MFVFLSASARNTIRLFVRSHFHRKDQRIIREFKMYNAACLTPCSEFQLKRYAEEFDTVIDV